MTNLQELSDAIVAGHLEPAVELPRKVLRGRKCYPLHCYKISGDCLHPDKKALSLLGSKADMA